MNKLKKQENKKKVDKIFITNVLKLDSTHRKASDYFIGLGFKF